MRLNSLHLEYGVRKKHIWVESLVINALDEQTVWF